MSVSLGVNGANYSYPETGETSWGTNSTNFASAVSAALTKLGLGSTLTADAVIDIVSTTKGILIPRMTTTQRDAISSPSTGLMVFNTSTNKFNIYYSAAWNSIASEAFVNALVNNSPNWASPSTSTAPSESAAASRFVKQDLGLLAAPYVNMVHQQTSGTQGGAITSGSYQVVPINTSKTNTISGASLASNRITLPTGTYYIQARTPVAQSNGDGTGKVKIYNFTDSTDLIIGSSSYVNSPATGYSDCTLDVSGRFTLAAEKEIQFMIRIDVTTDGNGYGYPCNYGDVEIYASIEIYKIG